MKNQLIGLLVFLQITIIAALFLKIYQQYRRNLGALSVNPIKKEYITKNPTTGLRYFYEPKPNTIESVNEWVPYKGIYTINSDALNERFEYPVKKSPKAYRIVTLGDSYTFGLYVDTKDSWPEQLEDRLSQKLKCKNIEKFEVINLGVHGYDIQYSEERYRIRGQKYDPNLVIFLIHGDDFMQVNEFMLEKEREYAKTMRETGEFQRAVSEGNNYPSWTKAIAETYNILGETTILKLQQSFLQDLRAMYKNKLLLTTFSSTINRYKKPLQEFVKQQSGVYLYDNLVDLYRDKELFYAGDGHPTRKGHQKIAENIFGYLIEKKLISCL